VVSRCVQIQVQVQEKGPAELRHSPWELHDGPVIDLRKFRVVRAVTQISIRSCDNAVRESNT